MTFTEKLNQGILSKDLFLKSDVTQGFIKWLLPYIIEDKNLQKLGYSFKSFIDAVEKYEWGNGNQKDNFEKTYQRFFEVRNKYKNFTDEELKKKCLDILKWGGVLASNKDKIQVRADLREFLNKVIEQVNKNEIIIYDLNPNYINSGFTKIYTSIDENFQMYDGRVGSSLCYLIKNYLSENNIIELPPELLFAYGIGRGQQNRNPSKKTDNIKFPEITQNRMLHFISNIKANWLLNNIAEKTEFLNIECLHKKAFALQSALFILGVEVPTSKNDY
jgi:hypothetical protein